MIYILIPIHNRKKLTLECLASLAKQNYTDYEFIIVDDGSTDGSGEAIKKTYPEAKVIRGDGNWWWTKSMNEGMRYILEKSHPSDFVLTLNDDTEVDTNYLQTLLDVSVANDRALVGSIVKNFYDHNWIQDAGVQINWKKFMLPKSYSVGEKKVNKDIGTLSCRGLLIPIEVFHTMGLFSKILPHYGADYDFSMRAKRHGFTLMMSHEAIVYSKDQLGDKERPFWQKYFSRRSSLNIPMQIVLATRNAPGVYLKLKCIAIILGRFVRALFTYLFKK